MRPFLDTDSHLRLLFLLDQSDPSVLIQHRGRYFARSILLELDAEAAVDPFGVENGPMVGNRLHRRPPWERGYQCIVASKQDGQRLARQLVLACEGLKEALLPHALLGHSIKHNVL